MPPLPPPLRGVDDVRGVEGDAAANDTDDASPPPGLPPALDGFPRPFPDCFFECRRNVLMSWNDPLRPDSARPRRAATELAAEDTSGVVAGVVWSSGGASPCASKIPVAPPRCLTRRASCTWKASKASDASEE